MNINIHFRQCVLQEGGSMLLVSRAKLHKGQGYILVINMFQELNMARPINLL